MLKLNLLASCRESRVVRQLYTVYLTCMMVVLVQLAMHIDDLVIATQTGVA